MIWKRSTIIDSYHKFPSFLMTLKLKKEEIQVDANYGARCPYTTFDPTMALDFEDAITGQELIYITDDKNILLEFFSVKTWDGPMIEPEGEIDWDMPDPVDELLEKIADLNPEALYPIEMKEAVIGIVERFGTQPLVLLDKEKCIEILIEDGMPENEAEKFFETKILGAWMGEGTSCFATLEERLL